MKRQSDTEKEQKSGFPKISAMHVVIAVAVIVLAVIFIAKFGFGTDLLSPSSGEMAIVKRPVVTPVRTIQPDRCEYRTTGADPSGNNGCDSNDNNTCT